MLCQIYLILISVQFVDQKYIKEIMIKKPENFKYGIMGASEMTIYKNDGTLIMAWGSLPIEEVVKEEDVEKEIIKTLTQQDRWI